MRDEIIILYRGWINAIEQGWPDDDIRTDF